MRFLPKTWNDTLSVVVLVGYPALAYVLLTTPSVDREMVLFILGVLFAKVSDVVQHYFRKAQGEAPTGS